MTDTLDLSTLPWTVAGWTPHGWRFLRAMETGATSLAEIAPVPAVVPGSVQAALLAAGTIPDWNIGANARDCEWVENRHWFFKTVVPAGTIPTGRSVRLECDGLDYAGWVLVNGVEIAAFTGSFVPHVFDLTANIVADGDNIIEIAFDVPPRWLGQFGYTSRITEWKPRYNYTWDWTARLVQTGIWDEIRLVFADTGEISELKISASLDINSNLGSLDIRADITGDGAASATISLAGSCGLVLDETVAIDRLATGVTFGDFAVSPWGPNGTGERALYQVTVELVDANGAVLDRQSRQVGFRSVIWETNPGAPDGADPWLCIVNGQPLFLQGVNWTPIRPNFADVTAAEYRQRLELYRDLGVNLLRVWGGAFLEKDTFYDICDELGIMVWQEFPLSSSGVDNWPPEDPDAIDSMEVIVRSYIKRRSYRACLILWCGGNELQGALDGTKTGVGKPVTLDHPMMTRMNAIVRELDPTRRFLPSSSSGPRFMADRADMGKGLHHDVHGPWALGDMTMDQWREYWTSDDALFRSESGAPGTSSADLIRAYLGDYAETPGTLDNEMWRRTSWWIEWPHFVKELGREPNNLDEYVAWSQARQATALAILVDAEKHRFPAVGGVLLWMGHDAFPCTANTSIIDFWGRPKPAALAVGKIWNRKAS
ncbi:MAG TPA: glycoside hydrolase family 2 TIM barrel-domain containing protein [Capsulimonadaceae bacterium]|jgi:beta-mannosidase